MLLSARRNDAEGSNLTPYAKVSILSMLKQFLKAKRNFYCPSDPFNDDFCDEKEIQLTSFMEAVSNPDIFSGSNEVSLNDLVDECINYNPALFYSIPRRSFYQIRQEIEKDCCMSFGLWSEERAKENESIHTAELYRKMAQELFLISLYGEKLFDPCCEYPDRHKTSHLNYMLFLCGFNQSIDFSDISGWFGSSVQREALKENIKIYVAFIVDYALNSSIFRHAIDKRLIEKAEIDAQYPFESRLQLSAYLINQPIKMAQMNTFYSFKEDMSTFEQCRLLYEMYTLCNKYFLNLAVLETLKYESVFSSYKSEDDTIKKHVQHVVTNKNNMSKILIDESPILLDMKDLKKYSRIHCENAEQISLNLLSIQKTYNSIKTACSSMGISVHALFDNYQTGHLKFMQLFLEGSPVFDVIGLPPLCEEWAFTCLQFDESSDKLCEEILKIYKTITDFANNVLPKIKSCYKENDKLCERFPFWKHTPAVALDDFLPVIFLRKHFVRFLESFAPENNQTNYSVHDIHFKTEADLITYFENIKFLPKDREKIIAFCEKLICYMDFASKIQKDPEARTIYGNWMNQILKNPAKYGLNNALMQAFKAIMEERLANIMAYCSFENKETSQFTSEKNSEIFEETLRKNVLFFEKIKKLECSIEESKVVQGTEERRNKEKQKILEKIPEATISNAKWQEYKGSLNRVLIEQEAQQKIDKIEPLENTDPQSQPFSGLPTSKFYTLFSVLLKKIWQMIILFKWFKI
ncbi:hypothetical protein IPH25_04125 [bacterium]|nr:MAG: hypothetical protein IPG37_01120 [bacterium]QQR61634.1 MAG: hypothetical protein IPH25_04125 [bacterium]QQR62805.1 MAG: hypothetical protein IPH67_05355 [bacterium]